MSPELETSLKTRYPMLLQHLIQRDGSTGWPEIECGDGWFYILDALLVSIERHQQESAIERSEGLESLRILRIKEKFGSLRVQTLNADPEIRAMIGLAERISSRVCELCGAENSMQMASTDTRCTHHPER